MPDQTSSGKKVSKLRGWLIKVGLVPPPQGDSHPGGQEQSAQQRQAQQDLTWHQLRHPGER